VKKADFSAGDIRIKVTGDVTIPGKKVDNQSQTLLLTVPDSKQVFNLVSMKLPTESEKTDLLPALGKAVQNSKTKFTIVGQVSETNDSIVDLSVDTFESVEAQK
jgi:hypothetical protein